MKKGFLIGLILAMGLSATVYAVASVFEDVEYGNFYFGPVHEMEKKGILTGYGDGKFGPNDTMTRGQLATALSRYDEHIHNTLQYQYGLSFICPENGILDCSESNGPLGSGCRNDLYFNWALDNCNLTIPENTGLDTSAWVEYDTGNFVFKYPAEWTPALSMGEQSGYETETAEFYDEGDNMVAKLSCPYVETGYEAWESERTERTYNDEVTKRLVLSLMTPPADDPDLGRIALILMYYGEDQLGEEFFNSCQLITFENDIYNFTEDTFNIYTEIYNSIDQ